MSRGMVVNYFVFALAIADLFNSTVTIPFTIGNQLGNRHLPLDFMCKGIILIPLNDLKKYINLGAERMFHLVNRREKIRSLKPQIT